MPYSLKMLGQRIIVERKEDSVTAGGIYIPDDIKHLSTVGVVKEIGKDCVWVKPGDMVFYSIHSGFDISVQGYEKCRCMNEEDLLGLAEEA